MPYRMSSRSKAAVVDPNAVLPDVGIAGRSAPELKVEKWFQLPAGKEKLTMKDFEGKVLVMLFFQSTGQGNHEMAFPKLKQLADHYQGNDKVGIIAVQTAMTDLLDNTPDKCMEFAQQYGLSIPFGHYTCTNGYPGMATKRGTYRNSHIPWIVVVGPDRIVKYNGPPEISVEMSIANIDDMIQ